LIDCLLINFIWVVLFKEKK